MNATVVAMRTVLVADDTAFVRDRFRQALEDAGHQVVTVGTGTELLAKLRTDPGRFDLIVLDLRLPQGHGVDLVRAVRKVDSRLPPLLVFSGTIASADEVRDLASLGIAGYVNEYAAVQHILPALSPHLFPNHRNRRSSPRVAIGVPVAYRFGNTIAAAFTLSLSQGGIAIRTTNPLEPGTSVKLRFRLPQGEKEIELEARVKWVERSVGMGLQFTSVQAADAAAIGEFVQGRFFSNRKA